MTNTSRRGFVSALSAYVAGAIVLSSSQISEAKQVKKQISSEQKNIGLVLSSNKNLMLAQLAVEMVRKAQLEKAYIQEVQVRGETFYRTVYPISSKSDIPEIRKDLEKLNYFSLKDSFTVPINSDSKQLFVQQSPRIFRKDEPKKPTHSLEKKLTEEKTVKIVSEQEVKKRMNDMPFHEYLAQCIPHVMKQHRDYYGREISKEKVKQVLTYIYQDAKEFNAPLVRAVSIYVHESKGDPDSIGDQKLAPNYSIGPAHMRIETINEVRNRMKAKGIGGVAQGAADSLKGDYRSLVRLFVWNLANNIERSGGDVTRATLMHNYGNNTKFKKGSYVGRVKYEENLLKSVLDSSN